jgi:hypothetical protein
MCTCSLDVGFRHRVLPGGAVSFWPRILLGREIAMSRPTIKSLTADEFNRYYPPGSRVWVIREGKEPFATITTGRARDSFHGDVIVDVKGMPIAISLNQLKRFDQE